VSRRYFEYVSQIGQMTHEVFDTLQKVATKLRIEELKVALRTGYQASEFHH
jgi:hypothetical protein